MSAFFIVETEGPPAPYYKHWATLDQALADFLRLYHAAEAEEIRLRFSS